MKRDLKFEAVYPYPAERVWRALTDPQELAQWLMPNDFQPSLGHKFQFKTKPAPGFDGVVQCVVIELEVPRRLAYTWHGGKLESVVSFTLESVGQGTRLVLEHKGFEGAGEWMLSAMLGRGWKRMVEERLPAVLQAGVGDVPAGSADCQFDAIPALIERYERGVTLLAEVLRDMSMADLDRSPTPGQWSARQTALHIVDAEIVGAERLRMIAAQPGVLLKSYAGDLWARELNYAAQPVQPAMELFGLLRQTTAIMLRQLPAAAWKNCGVHEESGEITLESYLLSHCEHAEAHTDEIEKLLDRVGDNAKEQDHVGGRK
jgi:uncharacterized protein YndB with AHSA1/START domain